MEYAIVLTMLTVQFLEHSAWTQNSIDQRQRV